MIVTTRVKLPKGELTDYLEAQEERYGKIYRKVYRIMIDDNYHINFEDERDLRNWLVAEFGITSRLAYTIVNEIKGRLKALWENKRWLLRQLGREIYQLNRKIEDLEKKEKRLKKKAGENKASQKELERLRNIKTKLYWLKNKRNHKKQLQENIRNQLKEGKPFRMGFGSRELFKKQFHLKENGYKNHEEWYADYIFYRDHNIAALGSAAETSGNQISNLKVDLENGTFRIRLRKFDSALRGKERYLWEENLRISYLGENIKDIVSGKVRKPLFHRYVRSPKGWYLHISFDRDCPEVRESGYSASCGIDYNDGFMELSASDVKGNLIYQEHIDLRYHGSGKRAQTEMQQKVDEILDLCEERNWELLGEDLDFDLTKAGMLKGETENERKFNKIVHSLDYSRYITCLERAAKKRGIKLTLVDPHYTSIDGYEKFGEKKKLNRHQAASYYISRSRFEAD